MSNIESGSLDTVFNTGKYFVSGSSIGGVPFSGNHRAILEVTKAVYGSSTYYEQRFTEVLGSTDNTSATFVRTYQSGWSSWRRCDNFGANTPSDLASLLGGISSFKTFRLYLDAGEIATISNTCECGFIMVSDNHAKHGLIAAGYNDFVFVAGAGVTVTKDTTGAINVYKEASGRDFKVQANYGQSGQVVVFVWGYGIS